MESHNNSEDRYHIYSECLKNIFDKIKKNITKKHPFFNELTTVIKDINDKISNDRDKILNADKYFIYMKMAIEGDNLKLIEGILENMQKLIKDNFLIGQSEDLPDIKRESNFHTQVNSANFRLRRKLIDTVVDTIVKLFNLDDENISLHTVKILYTIYKNGNTKIHSESLLKIFKICVRIYLSSRTTLNIDTTKSSLNQMITYLFSKMEQSNGLIISRECSLTDDSNYSSISSLNKTSLGRVPSLSILSSDSLKNNSYNSNIIYRNPIDDMIGKVLKYLVDDVCLYNAKVDLIQSLTLEKRINMVLPGIPTLQIRSIPYSSENVIDFIFSQNKNLWPDYTKVINPFVENERGNISGNFGWCFICRNTADFYCKDSRVPICSYECKLKIQEEDEKILKYQNGELINEDDIALLFFYDSISIFKALCKLVSTPISNTNELFNSKAKVISLELILSILEKPGNTFLSHREFIKAIKDDLMEGLLRNCVSDDVNLFSLSLNVFFKIWHHFREHLKHQISVLIETICLKILDSGNSTFNHKWCVMDNFNKFAGTPRFFVELYVNYDCEIDEKDLLLRLVTSLGKIAQGKYAKSQHMLSSQQEFNLRSKALDILTMMIRSVLLYTQDQVGWNSTKLTGFEEDGQSSANYGNINTLNPDTDYIEDQTSLLDYTIQNDNLKEKLDINRKMKYDISQAVNKFNLKIKSGILFLKKIGIVSISDKDQEAKDIAYFLKNSDGLKKDLIGEYLGEHHEINIKTLDYYTQSFNFSQTNIVDSIRSYLSYFQLPGEGQKIDRIMEKFAAKYFSDNPGVYLTADCAYYVAFSIIMLQTSIHNPNVKKKMTLEQFLNMLKGMNGGTDLDYNYVQDIYHQIQTKSIALTEHEEAKEKMENSRDLKKKHDLFKKETERMYQEGSEKLKRGKDKLYLKVCDIDHIVPMMESIWTVLLAMYSLALDDTDDETLNTLSIEGFSNLIKLCGLLNLDLQKAALINCFCGLTNLLQSKEMKDKHMNCVKAILQLSNTDARFLKGCWRNILELVSRIDYYHMVISGSKSELEIFFNEVRVKKKGSHFVDRDCMIEKTNMEKIVKEISTDDYEIIFNKTILLDQDSIIDFIKSLCEISRDELANKDSARIFSLQKLVEVAEFNMNRVRIVWANIWNIISEHLTEVGSNSNPVIAEKAVDSLRQLAKKFLQKDEISVYQFQKEFLKPFENILINNINVYRTKEYVITCIANLVLAEAPSIKSGWRIIFNIFQLAAEDSSKDIIRYTFETIIKVFSNHFNQVKDNFPELAYCLKKFSVNYPEEVINLYSNSYKQLDDISQIFAVITSLASILSDTRENIRKIACNKLFELIKITDSGNIKNIDKENFWRDIYKIIIKPVIDDLVSNKIASTLELVLFEICNIFEQNYFKSDYLINEFLQELSQISSSENEPISLTGIEALKYLINKENIIKNSEFWESICVTIAEIFNKTQQSELLELEIKYFNDENYTQKYQELVFKNIVFCIVQHNLIELCEFIFDFHMKDIRLDEINLILDCLRDSFELAYQFNIQFNLRKLISSHFMSDLNQIAALFKQQQDGTALYYKILNKVLDTEFYDSHVKLSCRKKLLIISHSILKQFVDRINFEEENDSNIGQYLFVENERLLNNMVPVIDDYIIPSLIKIEFESEIEYLDDFTKIFIDIIPCNIIEVRVKIKEVLTILFDKMKSCTNK